MERQYKFHGWFQDLSRTDWHEAHHTWSFPFDIGDVSYLGFFSYRGVYFPLETQVLCTAGTYGGVSRKPSRNEQEQWRPLSKTLRLHSELVGPMQSNMADKVCDGNFCPWKNQIPRFGHSLKHCLLYTSRDARTIFSGEANQWFVYNQIYSGLYIYQWSLCLQSFAHCYLQGFLWLLGSSNQPAASHPSWPQGTLG